MQDVKLFEEVLGYRFTDAKWLKQALTHRSYAVEHNERLEFLGDAILNMAVSLRLFSRFPELKESQLTLMRSSLVNREVLAQEARRIGLGDYLFMGKDEVRTSVNTHDAVLADAFEAILGAVFIDSDAITAISIVDKLFKERYVALDASSHLKDPKTQLQEVLQAKRLALPRYEIMQEHLNKTEDRYTVLCRVAGLQLEAEASGSSRKKAEMRAAALILDKMAL